MRRGGRSRMSRRRKKKREEEEDIMDGKYDISIRCSNFSSFTLNLTQQILDIQKDKASEEKSKEHTPILGEKKVFKEKTVDVFKGSIEREVKVRKRTERDQDGFDFSIKEEINLRDYSTG